jgi:hypothetical protein
MKPLFTILLACALFPALAGADLGDTLETARNKYGEPSTTRSPQILAYIHGKKYRVWQTYDAAGRCVIFEYSLLNGGPLTSASLAELDRANHLPGALSPRLSPGWVQVKWPDSSTQRNWISYQYTGGTSLYQVMAGQSRDDTGWYYSRMYLNAAGIQMIKAIGRGQ